MFQRFREVGNSPVPLLSVDSSYYLITLYGYRFCVKLTPIFYLIFSFQMSISDCGYPEYWHFHVSLLCINSHGVSDQYDFSHIHIYDKNNFVWSCWTCNYFLLKYISLCRILFIQIQWRNWTDYFYDTQRYFNRNTNAVTLLWKMLKTVVNLFPIVLYDWPQTLFISAYV